MVHAVNWHEESWYRTVTVRSGRFWPLRILAIDSGAVSMRIAGEGQATYKVEQPVRRTRIYSQGRPMSEFILFPGT